MNKTTEVTSDVQEIITGLKAPGKKISSKFFYDSEGSRIFQKIMSMPEYYLTDCEAEIFHNHKRSIVSFFCRDCCSFDLVELGAGDGQKTMILIEDLISAKINFRYIPVDISQEAVAQLVETMQDRFPDLSIDTRVGDYFHMLEDLSRDYPNRKVVMFLGSNLGNFSHDQSIAFLDHLRRSMGQDDLLFIGLDLKKDPALIRHAYNDPHGYTRDFNLNLLNRLNRELGANFNVEHFVHEPSYDTISGTAKSHLVSTMDQKVFFPEVNETISFSRGDTILTEQSQKYDMEMIQELARESGFCIMENFYDRRRYFVNSLWSIA